MNTYFKKGSLAVVCSLMVSTSGIYAITPLAKLKGAGIGSAALGVWSALVAHKNMNMGGGWSVDPCASPRMRQIHNCGRVSVGVSAVSFSCALYCARYAYKMHNNKKVIKKEKGT